MFDDKKEKSHFLRELHIEETTKKVSRISQVMEQVHSVNTLHLISAMSQIFLGSFVVALSILGVIKPIWLSTIISIFGSITTVIGLFFTYQIFSEADAFNTLLHRAIKRVINSQN